MPFFDGGGRDESGGGTGPAAGGLEFVWASNQRDRILFTSGEYQGDQLVGAGPDGRLVIESDADPVVVAREDYGQFKKVVTPISSGYYSVELVEGTIAFRTGQAPGDGTARISVMIGPVGGGPARVLDTFDFTYVTGTPQPVATNPLGPYKQRDVPLTAGDAIYLTYDNDGPGFFRDGFNARINFTPILKKGA